MLKYPRTINFGKGTTIPREITQGFPEEVESIKRELKEKINKDIQEYAINNELCVRNIGYSLKESPNPINEELELMLMAVVEVRGND